MTLPNNKGTNHIKVFTYPDLNEVYSLSNFQELEDVILKVEKRNIYIFAFATNHVFNRSIQLNIERVPIGTETIDFNTAVTLKTDYKPVSLIENEVNYINSYSNEAFKGGKSRLVIPVNLPANTIRWYYTVAASRDENAINQVSEQVSLFSDLSRLIDRTGALSFGIEALTAPPATDYIDVYLLDYQNLQLYNSQVAYSYILEGSRENIKSGNINISCCNQGQFYLAIKNPDSMHGVHALLEVVAITVERKLIMEAEKEI